MFFFLTVSAISTLMILSVTLSFFFSFLFGRVKNVERRERTFFSSFLFVYAVVAEKYREERTSSSTTIKASLYDELIFFYMPMYIWISSVECQIQFVRSFVMIKTVKILFFFFFFSFFFVTKNDNSRLKQQYELNVKDFHFLLFFFFFFLVFC